MLNLEEQQRKRGNTTEAARTRRAKAQRCENAQPVWVTADGLVLFGQKVCGQRIRR